jgi:hypothetical protein
LIDWALVRSASHYLVSAHNSGYDGWTVDVQMLAIASSWLLAYQGSFNAWPNTLAANVAAAVQQVLLSCAAHVDD